MRVKVVFVKDNLARAQSEETVDPGEGWDLFGSVPLPVPTPSPDDKRSKRSGLLAPRESYARVALVFVEGDPDEDVVDLRHDDPELEEAQTHAAISRRPEDQGRRADPLALSTRGRRAQPPPPPPTAPRAAGEAI